MKKKHRRLRVRSWARLGAFLVLLSLTCAMGVYALTPAKEETSSPAILDIGSAGAAPALSRPAVTPQPDTVQTVSTAPTALPTQTSQQTQTAAPQQDKPAAAKETPAPPMETPAPPMETPAPQAEGSPDLPYYLYFEKGSFTLTIYEKDGNGEYTKVYKTYRAAHGGNKTPAGTFTINRKERWHEFPDGGFVQYATRYHERLYLHSPLYGSENAGVMWPKYYDGELGIGNVSTGGCIRMVTEAARFIYEECPDGTVFEIVNGSPKNTTSDEPPSRNGKRFDPTDVNMTG